MASSGAARRRRRSARLIARPRLAAHVARRLARRPADLELLMGVIGDFVPAREVLRPRFLARLLVS